MVFESMETLSVTAIPYLYCDLENYDNDIITLLITGSTPLLPGDKVLVVMAISYRQDPGTVAGESAS